MSEIVASYGAVLSAWIAVAGLTLVQAVVADVAAIRGQHTPGMPVTSGHDDFLFRAVRAQSNTLENLPLFILLSLAAMLLGASPSTTQGLAWAFVGARMLHMAAYYADLRTFRSIAFAIGFIALIGLFVVSLRAIP
jgi:uncharacterized MAPEG superfamily protein